MVGPIPAFDCQNAHTTGQLGLLVLRFRDLTCPSPSPGQSAEVRRDEAENRAGWWTFPRRSEKAGRPGGICHGEAKNRAGRWTFPRRSGKTGRAGGRSHGEAKNRAGWWTLPRRSEKPGRLVDFPTAKQESVAAVDFRKAKPESATGGLSKTTPFFILHSGPGGVMYVLPGGRDKPPPEGGAP